MYNLLLSSRRRAAALAKAGSGRYPPCKKKESIESPNPIDEKQFDMILHSIVFSIFVLGLVVFLFGRL